MKKAIQEGHCANERAVKAAAEGDVSLQVQHFLPLSSYSCSLIVLYISEPVRAINGSLRHWPQ